MPRRRSFLPSWGKSTVLCIYLKQATRDAVTACGEKDPHSGSLKGDNDVPPTRNAQQEVQQIDPRQSSKQGPMRNKQPFQMQLPGSSQSQSPIKCLVLKNRQRDPMTIMSKHKVGEGRHQTLPHKCRAFCSKQNEEGGEGARRTEDRPC